MTRFTTLDAIVLVAYLLGTGIPYREIMEIRDARQILMVYRAMLYCLSKP